jgi:pyruvate kinase
VTRAKIVATLGPASASQQRIRELVDAGLDVARLNVSHGSHSDHEAAYRGVRHASEDTGRSVGVLVDLQGPKIRLGRFAHGRVTVTAGDELVITTDDVPGDQPTLVDDGRVALDVTAVVGREVRRGSLSADSCPTTRD